MKKDTCIILMLVIIILIVLLNKTYAIFYSNTKVETEIQIAKYDVVLNNSLLTSTETTLEFDNITWENSNANSSTLAPGSKGEIELNIDSTNVDVAFDFIITISDHTTDENKLLTVTKVTLDDEEISLDNNTVIIFFGLNDTSKKVLINLEWINDENNNETDSLVGNGENKDNVSIKYEIKQVIE